MSLLMIGAFTGFCACALILDLLIHGTEPDSNPIHIQIDGANMRRGRPKREDKVARTDEILSRADWHHEKLCDSDITADWHMEQLECQALELCQLHGYEPASEEGSILMECVLDQEDFEEAMEAIMDIKRQRGLF